MKNVTIRSFEVESGPYATAQEAVDEIKATVFPHYHDVLYQPNGAKQGWYIICEYVKTYEIKVSDNRVTCTECNKTYDYDEHETACPYCGFDHKDIL